MRRLTTTATAALLATVAAMPATAEGERIALIVGVANDAYYGSVQCGVERAADMAGATVETQAPNTWGPADQIPILEAVIGTSPDAIVIAPTDDKALFQPLQRATEEGIKVVLVDTGLQDTSIVESSVTSDNVAAGRVAGQELLNLLGDNPEGSVMTVGITAGVSTTDDREAGFAEVMNGADGINYLGHQYTNNSVQKADEIVSAALIANPDLVGIFSTAAFNTEGAVSALRAAGKLNDVKIVGFNANPPGVEQLEREQVAAQVVLKPYDSGFFAGQAALNALNGLPTAEQVLTGSTVATADNLEDPAVANYLYSFDCPEY